MDEKFLKHVARLYPDSIMPPYDAIIDMDGFDAICTFSKSFSGGSVYIPRLRTIFGQCLEKDMIANSKYSTVRELMRKYDFSERHVRNILRGRK